MAQRFLTLEEAAEQLGITKERLLALREANRVTGYKDGASWKFRSEVIDKLAEDGIPSTDASASDLALNLDDEDDDYTFPADSSLSLPAETPTETAASDDDELTLGGDDELTLGDDELSLAPADEPAPAAAAPGSGSDLSLDSEEMVAGPASDISLDDVDEPTVAGLDEGSDDALALDDDGSIDINTDSILLSENELGVSMSGSPSTIIGKADLDADLDLSPIDKGAGPASDVRLASESDVLPIGDDDLGLDLPSPSGNFEGLEELEVDLEAESSRILAPEDVAKAQAAAKASESAKKAAASKSGLSDLDLDLAPLGSDIAAGASDINLGGEKGSSGSLAGLSALELDDDDDQVLGDGSDVTLSGESSGINIISPSDSGLALDEVPLDLSGSAPIGSSLDLGMGSSIASASDVSLEPLAINVGPESKIGDFQLTPLGDDDGDDEKDSSQVIALDEISEESAGAPLASGFGEEAGMMSEDFGLGLTPGGAAPVALAPAGPDTPFSLANVLLLACCLLVISLCGMMTYDLVRNIWHFDEVGKINSTLLQALNPFLGR